MPNFPAAGRGSGGTGSIASKLTIGRNGHWFIDGKDTGQSSTKDPVMTGFKQNEIVTVDAKTGKLKPSGVFAHDGEIETEPDSVIVGSHEISSSAEGVNFTNRVSKKVYAPLWQEVKPDAKEGFIRSRGQMESLQRFDVETDDVTNPVFTITPSYDETVFSLDMILANDVTDLVLEINDKGEKLHRSRWSTLAAGEINLMFNTPSDFKANTPYELKFLSSKGDVVFKGDSNGNPKYKVNFVKWVDEPVASKSWVNSLSSGNVANPVTHVSLVDSDKLQMTHADGTKNVIALPTSGGRAVDLTPLRDDIAVLENALRTQGNDIDALKQKFGNLEHSVDDLDATYIYTGSGVPAYPDEAQGRYFVTLKGQAAREIDLDIPSPSSGTLKDGTMFFLENDNSQASVTLSTPVGYTIENANTLTIPPKHHILLFKKGMNWVVAMNKGIDTVSTSVSADDISRATDRGEFTGSGSLKDLGYGWWVVKATNTGVTGRPSDSQGDLIVFKQGVSGSDSKPGYGIILAFGKDTDNKDAIWAEYRDGTQWTPWFKVNDGTGSPVDLSTLNRAVAVLQTRTATMTSEINGLKTSVGNIYAPSKAIFDTAVNALIDAKINALKPGGGTIIPSTELPRIYALFSNSIPTSLAVAEIATSTNGKATLTRSASTNSRIAVLIENDIDEADRVTGISVNGGLPSVWTPRDTVINGKKYRVLFSAGAYTETSVSIQVNFR